MQADCPGILGERPGIEVLATVDVSIVIPAWSAESTIRESIESVLAQQTDHTFEVIVVDSSSDHTADIVREFPQVKLVKLDKRTYSGAARNIGIAEASAPIIFFMDSDVIVEPRWIDKMLDWHALEDCALVSGAVLNGNPESIISWASYITEFTDYLPTGQPRYKQVGVTANLSCKRWALEKYNGFNPSLKQYVDTEFGCRLNNGGDKILFVPSILVKHKHRTTLRAYLKHEVARGRSAVAVRRCGYLPHSGVARYRSLCALLAGPVFVRLVYTTIGRIIRAGMLPAWQITAVAPVAVLGLMAWTMGFLAEGLCPKIKIDKSNAILAAMEKTRSRRG